ncbi:MAG: hypothetical protein JWM99_4014, partial [Verrucomicrobiales bacterium]|nr:hypothetical protein [Verrucomicrobiales bacterium]
MIEAWVALSALLSLAGWLLSWFGALTTTSYVILSPVLLIAAIYWGRNSDGPFDFKRWLSKRQRTFSRSLPLCFALLAGLALLGALIHLPNNHDGLTYRVPRMLHWMAEGRWHWFDASDSRMNSRTCATEWILMPILALTHSDRLFWLPNFFCFLLLPGLFFRVFRIAGVRRRVAWNWMWLLPTGYGFILQAGSIANDLPAVVFGLAAVDFAVRAARLRSFRLLMLSMLSASLLSSVKTSNAPLMLVWLLPALASYKLVLARPFQFIFFAAWAVLISFLPTALLNVKYCGDWTGYALEKVAVAKDPITGIVGNTVGLLIENSVPPIFPFAGWWNAHIDSMPARLHQHILDSFEALYGHVWELQQEEIAGLGFGIMLLIAAACTARLWDRPPQSRRAYSLSSSTQGSGKDSSIAAKLVWWGLVVAPWVSLLVYMSKAAIYPASRLLLPFYPFLLVVFLRTGAAEAALRTHVWKRLVQLVLALAFLVIILTPSRPLWPSQKVFTALEQKFPGKPIITRANRVYYAYATRHDVFSILLSYLGPDVHKLGWISGGAGLETDLWRPFGSRVVVRASITYSAAALVQRELRFIVLNRNLLPRDADLETWLA